MRTYYKVIAALLLCLVSIHASSQTDWKKMSGAIADRVERTRWLLRMSDSVGDPADQLHMLEAALELAQQLHSDSLTAKAYHSLGNYDRRAGDMQTAWNDFQLARLHYIKAAQYDNLLKVIYMQATGLLIEGRLDSALSFLNRSGLFVRLAKEERMKLYLRSLEGIARMKQGMQDSARRILTPLLADAERIRDTQLVLSTMINLGILSQDSFEASIAWYKKGVAYARNGSPAKYAELLVKIGELYTRAGDKRKDSALHYFLEAEKYIDYMIEPVYKANLYNYLGSHFMSKAEYRLALAYKQKGYSYVTRTPGKTRNMLLHNLALNFAHLQQYDSAGHYMKLFEQVVNEGKDDYLLMLYYKSRPFISSGRHDSCALETVSDQVKALSYAVKVNDTYIGNEIVVGIAECIAAVSPGKFGALGKEALGYAAILYEITDKGDTTASLAELLSAYALLESAYGSKDKSLKLYRDLVEMMTSLAHNDYYRNYNQNLIKFKTGMKDKEIELLKEQEGTATFRTRMIIVALLAAALVAGLVFVLYTREHKTRKLLKERNHKVEQLLREVHHRVKNNLQIVSSFINIQLDRIRDPGGRQALQDTATRIMALAGLHQSLYRQGDLSRIQLKDYLAELCRMLGTSLDHDVAIECDLDNLELDIDQAIPMGLAVNELVTNALKHAFVNEGGKRNIFVELKRRKEWELVVRDNGRGLPPNLEPEQLPSIGMRLVQDIAETQLKGKFSFYNDSGAVFRITFMPLAA